MGRKRLKPRLNLDRPLHWFYGNEWPRDDGRGYHGAGANGIYACWDCKVTAKAMISKAGRCQSWLHGRRSREFYDRSGLCRHCGKQMQYMGNKWRPGKRGKWLTREQSVLAKARRSVRL